MENLLINIQETCAFLHQEGIFFCDTAIVCGTGLSALESIPDQVITIPYTSIPHFVPSTVDGHNGKLVYGSYGKKNILVLSGRFHYYEGYDMGQITYYIHVLKALGCKELIITNASGGINTDLHSGQIVAIKDHINLFAQNPLRGINFPSLGNRFPDMSDAYSRKLRSKLHLCHDSIQEVVYLGWPGPSLETPAEYRMAGIIGADVVGMSTVPEVIVAKYRGLDVLALSIVSNTVDHNHPQEATLEDIIASVKHASQELKSILLRYIDLL